MTKPYIPPESGLKPITDLDRKTSPVAGACFALFIVLGFFSTIYATSFEKLNLFPDSAERGLVHDFVRGSHCALPCLVHRKPLKFAS